jgi:hypothetical protein
VAEEANHDLAVRVRSLLARIREGREQAKEASSKSEALSLAKSRSDLADRLLADSTILALPQDNELRLRHKEQQASLVANAETCHEQLRSCWLGQNLAFRYIFSIEDDVKALVRRLPPVPKLSRYAESIKKLRIRREDVWIKSEDENSDLSILELKLNEMLTWLERRSPPSPVIGRLSTRDGRIADIVAREMSEEAFERFSNSQIVRLTLRQLRRALGEPGLTEPAARVSLNRIRKARGYPSSKSIRTRKAS